MVVHEGYPNPERTQDSEETGFCGRNRIGDDEVGTERKDSLIIRCRVIPDFDSSFPHGGIRHIGQAGNARHGILRPDG